MTVRAPAEVFVVCVVGYDDFTVVGVAAEWADAFGLATASGAGVEVTTENDKADGDRYFDNIHRPNRRVLVTRRQML